MIHELPTPDISSDETVADFLIEDDGNVTAAYNAFITNESDIIVKRYNVSATGTIVAKDLAIFQTTTRPMLKLTTTSSVIIDGCSFVGSNNNSRIKRVLADITADTVIIKNCSFILGAKYLAARIVANKIIIKDCTFVDLAHGNECSVRTSSPKQSAVRQSIIIDRCDLVNRDTEESFVCSRTSKSDIVYTGCMLQ